MGLMRPQRQVSLFFLSSILLLFLHFRSALESMASYQRGSTPCAPLFPT
jgi:hypothetical protein